jgi:glyoxylase-like metal-dependent hydrolase (beta-lactamase superfamily II)
MKGEPNPDPERVQTLGSRAVEIVEGVHRIGPDRHGYTQGGYSQAYLFEDGAALVLVDTGFEEDANGILKYLWSIGRSPNALTDIAITHAHRSHLGGLAMLKRLAPNATVHSHIWESDIIDGGRASQAVPLKPLFPLTLYPLRILQLLGVPKHVPCPVDHHIDEGDRIGPLEVLHTPGHTPGCVCFYWRERGIVAVGDAILTWPKLGGGWPGFNLDERRYQRSLRRLVDLEPVVVCPGHGPEIKENTAALIRTLPSS